MRIPEGRELAFQLLVSLFVGLACLAAVPFVLGWGGTEAALVGVGTFILTLFVLGLASSSRSPGDNMRS